MSGFLEDLRYGLRGLRRAPGHAAIIVATLALGIAAGTTVFSVMNPYLLRPLPYADADRLIQLEQVDAARGMRFSRFSLPQWADWRATAGAFADVAAYRYNTVNLADDAQPERAMVSFTTANVFDVLGVGALHGRSFVPSDGDAGAEAVVVLSHELWTARYGADPSLIGSTVRLDGEPHTVVGVMPPRFTFPWNEVKAWVPERTPAPGQTSDRARSSYILVGRLAAGFTARTAEAELLRVQSELGAQHPETDGQYAGVTMRPLREALNFGYEVVRLGFTILLAAVGLLLLLACVNVAGLVLARATARSQEVAVRRALGAGRARLARQLLAESALLAVAGGVGGLLLAAFAIAAIGARLPEDLFRVGTATLDGRVFGFALAVTLLTPLVFGLSPALAASRTSPADVLRPGAAGGERAGYRARRVLVVAQVGLAVVLLTATSLLARSYLAVRGVDTGMRPDRMLVLEVTPPAADYPDAAALTAYYDPAIAGVGAVPGVSAVGATNVLPLNHETPLVAYAGPGSGDDVDRWPLAIRSAVSPGWFVAVGTPILAGRVFLESDGPAAERVVVVSRELAERAWPGEEAVGRTLRLSDGDEARAARVVGVVGGIRWRDLVSAPEPHVYVPLAQAPSRRRFLVAAVDGGAPTAIAPAARQALARVDAALPVRVRPMTDVLRESDFQWVVSSMAVGAFGLFALLLAGLGIYGVLAYSVARRRRELGIRAALGASAPRLKRMVLKDGLRLLAYGLGAGLLLAAAVGRLLRSFLYGVGPFDPTSLLAVAALFLLLVVVASLVPAGRAARLEPGAVLREQ